MALNMGAVGTNGLESPLGSSTFPGVFPVAFQRMMESVERALVDYTKVRGTIGTTNLNDLANGWHYQAYSANSTAERNYPVVGFTGWVSVVNAKDVNNRITQLAIGEGGQGIWRRSRVDYTWGAWEQLTSSYRVRGALGTLSLDTIADGAWQQLFSANATLERAYPVAGFTGTVMSYQTTSVSSQIAFSDAGVIYRRSKTSGAWGAWVILGGGSSAADGSHGVAAAKHAERVNAARKRLAGGVGTAGRAAVALRFDDGHDAFRDVVLPLLRKYDLPSYMAVTDRYVGESTVTYTDLRGYHVNDAAEVTAHSRDHGDSVGEAAIKSNVFTWADDLQTNVGQIVVDTWTFPGGSDYGGLGAGSTAAVFTDTYAGRLLLQRYAVVHGATSGYLQPLTGDPTIGQTHVTVETYTVAQIQEMVGRAQNARAGITLMIHPSKIGTTGNISVADFESALAWIAAEREAGRLVVLTGTGMGFAHAGFAHRVNFLANGDFSNGLTSWGNTTGWTVTDNVATTSTGTPLAQDVLINPYAGCRGAGAELVYRVKGTAGDVVRTRVTNGSVLNATKDHTLTGSDWVEVRKCFFIPTGVALGSNLAVSVGRVSGGSVQVRDVRLQTI